MDKMDQKKKKKKEAFGSVDFFLHLRFTTSAY